MAGDYDYEERSDAELRDLQQQFMAPVGAPNYVAKAAPGWDTHGLWHCFGAGHRSGYAAHAVSLHWMLSKVLGIETQLVPHRNLDIDIETFPPDRYDMLFEWHKSAVGHPHALFSSFPPEVSAELDGVGPPLIPYCAFEGTKVSGYCRDLCNGKAFEQVWVVSDFVRDAMLAGGVKGHRVRTVRPMLCDGPWTMTPVDVLADARSAHPVTPDSPFTFGVLGTWQKRKGMHDLIRAYFQAFERSEPVQLVIRTSVFGDNLTIRGFKEKLTEEVKAIAAELGDHDFPHSQQMPRLRFLLGTDATDQEVIEWLGSLDCYANPSYGEGLGIPHVWAKAQGVPMVSTGYGAVGQMLNELAEAGAHHDSIIPFELQDADPIMCQLSLMFDRDTQWGVYDPQRLSDAMQMQFEQGRRLDLIGAGETRAMFSEERCTEGVRSALTEVLDVEWADKWLSD